MGGLLMARGDGLMAEGGRLWWQAVGREHTAANAADVYGGGIRGASSGGDGGGYLVMVRRDRLTGYLRGPTQGTRPG